MDNKELPQEYPAQSKMVDIEPLGNYLLGVKHHMAHDGAYYHYTDACTALGNMRKKYNSIIEGKDKEIGELKEREAQSDREADHWEELYIMAYAKLEGANETITTQKAEIERITELLKDNIFSAYMPLVTHDSEDVRVRAKEYIEECWNIYKKEHNL